ncbi:MAG: ABC transporter permease [Acidimicrobiales bacterium]
MGAVWFIARSGAARQARSGLALAALVGLAGAVVLAAWAGARRTDSAYGRLTELVNHADIVVTADGDASLFDPSIALDGPGVAAAGQVNGYSAVELRPDGTLNLERFSALLAPADTTAFYELNRFRLAEGRLPDPEAADEVVVPELMRDNGYPIGTVVDLCLVDFFEALSFGEGVLEGTATPEQEQAFVNDVCVVHHLRVVGASLPGPDEVVLRESSEADVFMVASPALAAHAGRPELFNFVLVKMTPGADIGAYVDGILDATPPDAGVSVQASALRTTVVDRTIEPYVRALALFALVAALASLGVLGPAIVGWAGTPNTDRAPLLALGLPSHQLRLAAALRGAALGLGAAAVAIVIAIGVSGQFPIGIAARIEPRPGVRIDGLTMVLGAVSIVLVSALLGALSATRASAPVRRPSRVAELLQGAGVGPSASAGVRAALSGDGRGAGALRSVAGVAVAIVAVVTALTYQAGLGRLLDTPERYGWTWDNVLEAQDEGFDPQLVPSLEAEPAVTGLSLGYRIMLLRDGAGVQSFAFDRVKGDVYPLIVDGRAPRGDTEIALGGQTLDRLGASIGDELTFRGPNGAHVDLTVVGTTLLPFLSLGQDLSVAEGGLVDVSLLAQLGQPDVAIAILDLAPGTSREQIAALEAQSATPFHGYDLDGPTYTADLRGYDGVRGTPLLLAGILAVLGLGVLAHTIAGSVRQRGRELAVLRSVGFSSRDLRATVRWNALTLVVVCLVLAVPVGVGLGRTFWTSFAQGIGLVDDAVTPVGAIAVVGVATLLGAVVLAVLPGRRAGQVAPATVLRSE